MYTVTSCPFVSRTRATFRSAEFGFFGVVVYTRVHTPRFWGAAMILPWPLRDLRPVVASFLLGRWRPLRTSWFVVGIAAESSDGVRAEGARRRRASRGSGRGSTPEPPTPRPRCPPRPPFPPPRRSRRRWERLTAATPPSASRAPRGPQRARTSAHSAGARPPPAPGIQGRA